MNIEQCEYYYTTDTLYCGEHNSSVACVLEINGIFIPLCQTCVDELYKALSQFATKEATK